MGLETVEILLDIEDYFHMQISDAEASSCITVGDLRDLLVRRLSEGNPADPSLQNNVWNGIVDVLTKNGYPSWIIRPESRWIGDITANG